jgi:phytoene dehydrogenase-like protein
MELGHPLSSEQIDIVIIGGGHNGLVWPSYLAQACLRVTVLERRSIAGGAAVTESFAPAFRNSTASYTVSLLNPKIIADMSLAEHGLRLVEAAEFSAAERSRSAVFAGNSFVLPGKSKYVASHQALERDPLILKHIRHL